MKRVFFDIFLILALFLLPWWVGFILAIMGIFLFKNFYEFLFFSIFIYVVYGFENTRIISSEVYLSLSLVLIFFILSNVKKYIIFYK